MATLTEELAAMRRAAMGDGTKPGRIPAAAAAIMQRVTEEQRASGFRAAMPAIGTRLPGFALANTVGATVTSAEALARGKLVLSFFRGAW